MAVYKSRQKATGSATPITPSNASPVALVANNAVKPTTAGYAIASYDSVTPSSTPESVSSGDIVKIGGSGVIVDAITPAPTSITPSNSSPVALTSNTPVTPTASGYAIESYSIITPNSSAPTLDAGSIYKPNSNGYAINSYQSKTPSASGASFNSGFVKMSSSGYAFSALPPNFMSPDKTQVISSSTGGTTNISVTQKPRYIVMATWNAAGSQYGGMLGVVDVTNSTAKRLGYSSGSISWGNWSGYADYFTSITSSTVTYKSNWSTNTATRSMILIYY